MGILNDLKRLFFVNKSVVKSAADKAADASKDAVTDLKVEAEAAWEKAKVKGEELLDKTSEKIDQLVDDTNLDEALDKAKAFTKKFTGPADEDKVDPATSDDPRANQTDATRDWINKAGEKAEELGSSAAEKFQDLSEKIGKKAMDLSDELSEKAHDLASRFDKKLDEIHEKAEAMKKEEAAQGTSTGHSPTRHDENPDLTGSMLEGTEGFFEKAERFASGKPVVGTDDTAGEADELEAVKKPKNKAYGFEDLDGDGNEIIDDAIIEEE